MHKLEIRRRELGFTQIEVAELAGVSSATISRIERDKRQFKIRFETAALIAVGLDSQLHTLFEGTELSDVGRMPQTGRPVLRLVINDIPVICGECKIEVSVIVRQQTKVCEDCGTQVHAA